MRVDKANRQVYLWGVISPSKEDGVSEQDLLEALDTLGRGAVTVRINSPGGSVDSALAMLSLLRTHNGQVTVVNEALAASAATFFFTERKFRRIASPTSMAMIHEPIGSFFGRAEDFDTGARTLRSYTEQFLDMYQQVLRGVSRDEIRQMLAEESWFTAKQQVALGLVERIDEKMPAVTPVKSELLNGYRKAPASLRQQAAASGASFPKLRAAKVKREQLRLAKLRRVSPTQYQREVGKLQRVAAVLATRAS